MATPTPEPQPEVTPEPEASGSRRTNRWLLLIFLLLAAAALLLLISYLMDPARRAKRNPRKAADILMNAVDTAMERLYRRRRPGETVIEYYTAAAERVPDLPLTDLAEAYSAKVYGRRPMRAELPLLVWEKLTERLTFLQRAGVVLGWRGNKV